MWEGSGDGVINVGIRMELQLWIGGKWEEGDDFGVELGGFL